MREILPHITVDPAIRLGKPVIAGTRVPVELIVAKIAGGMTLEEVMTEYALTREQVLATLQYASHVLETETLLAA